MKIFHDPLNTWEEFVDRVKPSVARNSDANAPFLFRGQGDSSWALETTLERLNEDANTIPTVDSYYAEIRAVAKRAETITGKHWDFSDEDGKPENISGVPRAYECMAYLRQNGYPSPLLDWTASPYIAAFFAFRTLHVKASAVSIYQYFDSGPFASPPADGKPSVKSLGSWIATDKKHFLQQSRYTICRQEYAGHLLYTSHEKALDEGAPGQDFITKFTLPCSVRGEVLTLLHSMNIHAYSLFNDLPSLMETIAREAT